MDVVLPPEASDLTLPFWTAASEHKLVRPLCDHCQRSFFVPQMACPRCRSESWSYAESTGRGRVYSFTVVHRGPSPEHRAPYVVAIIDLEDEGWSMMSNVIGCRPEAVEIGQRVSVCFGKRRDGSTVPQFRPVEESAQ